MKAFGEVQADNGAEAAIEVYRSLLERYHRTLDLMSERGLRAWEDKRADAEAYAEAVGQLTAPGSVVDVGSGAGLPGVVVAARVPRRRVALVERRRRRATFLTSVVARCGLENAAVFGRDVRDVGIDEVGGLVAAVTAQAVAAWPTLYQITSHLQGDAVTMISRRGPTWAEEVAALDERVGGGVEVVATERLGRGGTLVVLQVPGGRTCR